MSDSKVFMFPENGNNNNGFGLNGWGGGLIGFILGILLGNGGLFGGNWGGFGANGAGLANFMNNDNNTDLVLNAINGTDSDVRLLATTLNTDVNEVRNAITGVQSHICEYYEVDEDSEPASYLIGYLARLIYKFISRFV